MQAAIRTMFPSLAVLLRSSGSSMSVLSSARVCGETTGDYDEALTGNVEAIYNLLEWNASLFAKVSNSYSPPVRVIWPMIMIQVRRLIRRRQCPTNSASVSTCSKTNLMVRSLLLQ